MFKSGRRPQKSNRKGRTKKGAKENLPDKIIKEGPLRKRIAAGRITVPLGFFGQGVKSKIVRKNPAGCVLSKESQDFLNEDLHALLQSVPTTNTLRRSERISARSCNNAAPNRESSVRGSHAKTYYDSAADYYVKCQSEAPQQGHHKKSIFKEINHCYQEAAAQQRPLLPHTDKSDPFCKLLQQQLSSVRLDSRKVKCIEKIKSAIGEIDAIIDGKEPIESRTDVKSTSRKANEEAGPVRQLISQSKWSYETPGRQKLRRPVSVYYSSSISEIKPCLLQIHAKSKVPFELDPIVKNLTTIDKPSIFSDLPLPFGANAELLCENVGGVEQRETPFYAQRLPKARKKPGLPSFGDVPKRQTILVPSNRQPNVTDRQHQRSGSTSFERSFAPIYHEVPPLKLQLGGVEDLLQFDEPKDNYRSRDFSNRPRRGEVQPEQHFVMDEQLLLPTFPDLNDAISPLKFYPRKL